MMVGYWGSVVLIVPKAEESEASSADIPARSDVAEDSAGPREDAASDGKDRVCAASDW